MRSRLDADSASGLGSSWLHASQQSALSQWQVEAAGLAKFIHVCIGTQICFLHHCDESFTKHSLDYDDKPCDAVYLQGGDDL